MSNSFELGKVEYYTIKEAKLNDYINEKLDSKDYGLFWSINFEGDADTYLWRTKSEPKAGDKVYGHLEKAQKGKSILFKPDKEPMTDSKEENIARAVALKASVDMGADNVDHALDNADVFLYWLQTGQRIINVNGN